MFRDAFAPVSFADRVPRCVTCRICLQLRILDVKDEALANSQNVAQLQDTWQAHANLLTDNYRAQFARRVRRVCVCVCVFVCVYDCPMWCFAVFHPFTLTPTSLLFGTGTCVYGGGAQHAAWQDAIPLQDIALMAQQHWATIQTSVQQQREDARAERERERLAALAQRLEVVPGDLYSGVLPRAIDEVDRVSESELPEVTEDSGDDDDQNKTSCSNDDQEAVEDEVDPVTLRTCQAAVMRDPQLGAWLGGPLTAVRRSRRLLHQFVHRARVQRGTSVDKEILKR